MFYNEIYIPRVSDFNRNGRLSYEAILQILETSGSHHSDKAKDNVIKGSQHGIAWILVDWRVSVLRRTDSTEQLNITTWVRGKSGSATVYRDFVLTDHRGDEVVRAEAKFCLLDITTGKLTRISEDLMQSYEPENRAIFDDASVHLRAPTEYISEQTVPIRRSDIDFNGHVHNTRYMDYALEAIPQEIYEADAFSSIRIVYSKPIKENYIITVKYTTNPNAHIVAIYAAETLCTLIQLS